MQASPGQKNKPSSRCKFIWTRSGNQEPTQQKGDLLFSSFLWPERLANLEPILEKRICLNYLQAKATKRTRLNGQREGGREGNVKAKLTSGESREFCWVHAPELARNLRFLWHRLQITSSSCWKGGKDCLALVFYKCFTTEITYSYKNSA